MVIVHLTVVGLCCGHYFLFHLYMSMTLCVYLSSISFIWLTTDFNILFGFFFLSDMLFFNFVATEIIDNKLNKAISFVFAVVQFLI